jgi:poly-gamma-glutamate capsule biosynthesis protein CapA/YwtB (metallophosphatase superfamily)
MRKLMMNKAGENIIFYAVGDIGPDRADPNSIFRHVTDTIKQSDVAFTQLEVNLSNRGVGHRENARNPDIAAAIKNAGFNVVSFAGNHCLDAGVEAFSDTIINLKKQNLNVIGVGQNITEARKPAIVETRGTKIAFLAYNSILHEGYWAEENKPGCSPLRARTFYEPIDPSQPGTPSRAHTFPNRIDLEAMIQDIKRLRSQSDLIVVSMHCGIHFMPAAIAEYQRVLAHAAIDAGADLILQHHAHILKGVEVYSGKVIFYSLCNFALELRLITKGRATDPHFKELSRSLNPDWKPPYPEYPSFPFPPDSRKSLIAKCLISNKKIKKVSFLPTIINRDAEPEILSSNDDRFVEIVKYMEDITRDQGLDTEYVIEGNEVLIKIE